VLTFWLYVWQLDPGHTYDEHLILALKTGCDKNGPQELDDLDDLGDLDVNPNEGHSDIDEWFPQDGSNDRDWVIKSKSLSLGLRISF
jgi:hypothetical protein